MKTNELYELMGKFSIETFPKADSVDHLKKLQSETLEAIEDPKDVYEYADCLLCIFGAAYKAGFSYEELKLASETKLYVNKNRKWEKLEDGTYQHINK
jgi:predicted house-cleaning noncanonical NTP pyrophosphatase (MazG superfamily)